ncbi:hypothetical protein AALO_G00066120 [Alosa alosa]|uniref:Uncharacterized protein n=1 Tax=Alosa alosa TaxID=278164 RepID=A0AAV6H1Q7_9TELE|nr:hypothetical protein AALO_G00066120 [Alosa alosa]
MLPGDQRTTATSVSGYSASLRGTLSESSAIQTDDSVDIPGAVVEVGDGDSVLAGGHPVLLGAGVDLEDVRAGAVDRLLPEGHKEEVVDLLVPQHHRLPAARRTGVTGKLDHHLSTGLHLGSSGSLGCLQVAPVSEAHPPFTPWVNCTQKTPPWQEGWIHGAEIEVSAGLVSAEG